MSTANLTVVEDQMRDAVRLANSSFKLVRPLLVRKDDGYALTLRYGNVHRHFQQTFVVGAPNRNKMPTIGGFSREKIERTAREEHLTSLESADKEKKHYAGGIIVAPWGIGISGLDSTDDHCLATAIAVQRGWLLRTVAHQRYAHGHGERINAFLEVLAKADKKAAK